MTSILMKSDTLSGFMVITELCEVLSIYFLINFRSWWIWINL